jgi:AbrB family looped-hinge helix DNA binding protein
MRQSTPAMQTVIVSTKGQLTVPSRLRRHLGLKPRDRVEFYAVGRERFVATVRRPSRILDFAGDLAELDLELSEAVPPDRPTKP